MQSITGPKLCCQRHGPGEEGVEVTVDHCVELVGEARIEMVGLDKVGRFDRGGCAFPEAVGLQRVLVWVGVGEFMGGPPPPVRSGGE
jgi:hypothetical protein